MLIKNWWWRKPFRHIFMEKNYIPMNGWDFSPPAAFPLPMTHTIYLLLFISCIAVCTCTLAFWWCFNKTWSAVWPSLFECYLEFAFLECSWNPKSEQSEIHTGWSASEASPLSEKIGLDQMPYPSYSITVIMAIYVYLSIGVCPHTRAYISTYQLTSAVSAWSQEPRPDNYIAFVLFNTILLKYNVTPALIYLQVSIQSNCRWIL